MALLASRDLSDAKYEWADHFIEALTELNLKTITIQWNKVFLSRRSLEFFQVPEPGMFSPH